MQEGDGGPVTGSGPGEAGVGGERVAAGRNVVVAVVVVALVVLGVVVAVLVGPPPGDPAAAPTTAAPPSAPVAPTPSPSSGQAPAAASTAAVVPVEPSQAPVASSVPPVADPAAEPDPAADPAPGGPADGAAVPAPAWLGSRPLAPAGSGPVAPQETPPELLDRRLVTPDVLPAPTTGEFSVQVSAVPPTVLARSTWQPACPVASDELRYLLLPHWGFDGRLHTGEVLVRADAVDPVTAVFRAMFDERFPLEEVRVIRPDELDAAPTGDGNVTSAFVCRPSVDGGRWSRHAYGTALDVNPFHNPYDRGSGADRLVLPELATAYTHRDRRLPGMLDGDSAAVRAAEAAGWGWGGRWSSSKDWMHLSDDGS